MVDAELREHGFGETKRAFGFGYERIAGTGTAKGGDLAQPAGPHDDTQIRQMRQPLCQRQIRLAVGDRAEDDPRRRPNPSFDHARVGAVAILRFGAFALREAHEIHVGFDDGTPDVGAPQMAATVRPTRPYPMMTIAGLLVNGWIS